MPIIKGPWKLVSKSFSNQKLCFLRWQKHNKTLIKISVLLFTLFSPSYISPPEVGTHCVCEITARHRRRVRALFYFTSSTFFQVCKYLLNWCQSYNGVIRDIWAVLLLITSKISLFHPTCSLRREAKSGLDKKGKWSFSSTWQQQEEHYIILLFLVCLLQERVMESVLLLFKLLSILPAMLV